MQTDDTVVWLRDGDLRHEDLSVVHSAFKSGWQDIVIDSIDNDILTTLKAPFQVLTMTPHVVHSKIYLLIIALRKT